MPAVTTHPACSSGRPARRGAVPAQTTGPCGRSLPTPFAAGGRAHLAGRAAPDRRPPPELVRTIPHLPGTPQGLDPTDRQNQAGRTRRRGAGGNLPA